GTISGRGRPSTRSRGFVLAIFLLFLSVFVAAPTLNASDAGTVVVSASIEVSAEATSARSEAASNVVVWLTPVAGSAAMQHVDAFPTGFRIVQKHKRFEPHILVVPVGSIVEFPNLDPFFHNVFSLFDGKRFDLGLYEAGTTHSVKFDRVGISYIFCNIHQ